MIISPNMVEPMSLQELKRLYPEHRVRPAGRNMVTLTRLKCRSQAHLRKIARERGW